MSDPHDTCLEIENYLPLWAGGDLEADVLASVNAHVARCERCDRAAARARAARAALEEGLRTGSERMGTGRDPWPTVRASLRAEGLLGGAAPTTIIRPVRRRWNPAWPVAAAVLVGLFLAGTLLPSGSDPTGITGPAAPIAGGSKLAGDPVRTVPVGLRPVAPSEPRMRDTAWLFTPAPSADATGFDFAPPTDGNPVVSPVSQERVQLLPAGDPR